jgi:hypothetical protein
MTYEEVWVSIAARIAPQLRAQQATTQDSWGTASHSPQTRLPKCLTWAWMSLSAGAQCSFHVNQSCIRENDNGQLAE